MGELAIEGTLGSPDYGFVAENLRALVQAQVTMLRQRPPVTTEGDMCTLDYMHDDMVGVSVTDLFGGYTSYHFRDDTAEVHAVVVGEDGSIEGFKVVDDREGCSLLSVLHGAVFALNDVAYRQNQTENRQL
jgi:hypothetical protein